ncbi:HPr family phosphocarrier protein [Paenibacillus thermoaerophilus]|uniref:HPr family phosphocarrier protein n=1 Tax=Paenibacillus thermoaerophilus TaxID=1215385 RepID=A0ABW2V182_9BACL|nr:HPr family phosphocarrier protein [Paenibacillus thermoaerophilus]TMV19121.1 HPr family phosphocarrier protein [Paenibacillus thermoaerophilus]
MPGSGNTAIVQISQAANKFRSSIVLQYENKFIDVKSILGLYTTLVDKGVYDLHVHGPDAEEAKKTLAELFEQHNLKVRIVEDE